MAEIIDEIEKCDNYEEYFDFHSEKAKVLGDHLDFSMTDEGEGEIIDVKQYNSNTLDKFMLTCIKALQKKVENLEKEVNNG